MNFYVFISPIICPFQMSGYSILIESVFRPLHRLELRKIYRILGIQQTEIDCYALLSNGPDRIVTALRPEDVKMLSEEHSRVKTLRIVYTTMFGEPVVQFGVSGPEFTMN
jgi:hypothetical protein